MSYVIRNYGPSRQVPFGTKQICIERDSAIVTDDPEEVAAFTGQPNISIMKQPGTVVVPVPPAISEPLDYQKMSKRELLALATERGIEIPDKIKKQELIDLLMAWDGAQANPPEEEVEEEEDSEPDEPKIDDIYDTMKMRELLALMKERELTVPKNATKVQLVGLLRE